MKIRFCFIKREYFYDNKDLIKILDDGNPDKQSKRTHLCLFIVKDENRYCIPLRNNLGEDVRKYGRIGHSVPSPKRPMAGLDYRYSLIVNDEKYIERQEEQKIPNSQYKKIVKDYNDILKEFSSYVNGFKKAVGKRRVQREPLYRESSLINFIDII